VGKVSTMALRGPAGESPHVARAAVRDMQHYLSQTGKASTLYEELVSSTSKPGSKGRRETSESPPTRGEPERGQYPQTKSDTGYKKRVI
jgi:hypothetical protein